MKVWVQSFGTHFVYFFHVAVCHVLDKLFVIGLRVDGLQLLLVHLQHLVHTTLVLQLKHKKMGRFISVEFFSFFINYDSV